MLFMLRCRRHLIKLPFFDDIRCPEADPSQVGTQVRLRGQECKGRGARIKIRRGEEPGVHPTESCNT